MLGIVGFIVGFLCIASFAITTARTYITVPPRKLQLFTTAFGLLAAAMLVWALAIAVNSAQSTKGLMVTSDCLLLLGTGCMIQLLFNRSEPWLVALLGLAGSMLIGLRAFAYPPTAFVHNGLLYFNLSSSLRGILVGAFLLFWLPAAITVASYTQKDKSLAGFQSVLSLLFMALVVVSTLFVAARRPVIIVSLFVLIAALFLGMTAVNVVIQNIHKAMGAKHAAKSAAR